MNSPTLNQAIAPLLDSVCDLRGRRVMVALGQRVPVGAEFSEGNMEERGVNVDHATINRWVIKYSP